MNDQLSKVNPSDCNPNGGGRSSVSACEMPSVDQRISTLERQNHALRARLWDFESSNPTRPVDPRCIQVPQEVRRHGSVFSKRQYVELKASISHVGGNVSPILVSPLSVETPARGEFEVLGVGGSSSVFSYVLVYGFLRHHACLELGLPVKSTLREMTRGEAFEARIHENKGRADRSEYEFGLQCNAALQNGLFASRRQLATAIGVKEEEVKRGIGLVELPRELLEAFPSLDSVRSAWIEPLVSAWNREPDQVRQRALAAAGGSTKRSAAQVFRYLLG